MYRHSRSPNRRQSLGRDDTNLPKGECRYLLLHPEVRGQHCACVGFSLNTTTPGSSCHCGHNACYHIQQVNGTEDLPSDRDEIDALKEKVRRLEELLEEDRFGSRNSLSSRLSCLEEVVEKCKAEMESEVKTVFRGIEGLWHNIGNLQKQARYHDDRIESMVDAQQATQDDLQSLQRRVIEIDDSSMLLEDRIDALTSHDLSATYTRSDPLSSGGSLSQPTRPPHLSAVELDDTCRLQTNEFKSSTIQPSLSSNVMLIMSNADGGSDTTDHSVQALNLAVSAVTSHQRNMGSRPGSNADNPTESTIKLLTVSSSWTVHVSLLPKASLPFPFEKDTLAYKRCLSRGLHRVIAVADVDSKSFTTAVSQEFATLLKGRDWMPLVPKICDAENLMGLPMLRQLPMAMIDTNLYDLEFLKKNCATLDANGNILDLYIAMRRETFSWPELEASPLFLAGLEACWSSDPLLDGLRLDDDVQNCTDDLPEDGSGLEEKRSAGDLLRAWSPPTTRLKRAASGVSRTSSFGSSDGDSKRAKVQRQCVGGAVERVGRLAEAV